MCILGHCGSMVMNETHPCPHKMCTLQVQGTGKNASTEVHQKVMFAMEKVGRRQKYQDTKGGQGL